MGYVLFKTLTASRLRTLCISQACWGSGTYTHSWELHASWEPSFCQQAGDGFPNMFKLFEPKPIKRQIASYVAWKAVRFPLVAGTHERVLQQFFNTIRVRHLNEVTPDCLRTYCNKFPAQFQRLQFDHAMRQFFRYWRRMGVLSHEFTNYLKEDTIVDIIPDLSPTMHIDQVRRVRQLRREGLSLSQVKLKMETEDGKPYHLKQIHRWSRYLLPNEVEVLKSTLSPHSS